MMGTQPSARQPALFSYRVDLEPRVPADHLLRQLAVAVDLSFVPPLVRDTYGRCGHVSLDPRVIVKLMILLFLYDIPSERELMEQIAVRLDFLWFLGFDLDTPIPHHSVLSKARARWGQAVFEQLFLQTVDQCVAAGLVNGRLLHVDSTMVKAHAHRDSVLPSGPELVSALRQAYQRQEAKLQVVPAEPNACAAEGVAFPQPSTGEGTVPEPTPTPVLPDPASAPQLTVRAQEAQRSAPEPPPLGQPKDSAADRPGSQPALSPALPPTPSAAGPKLPVNQTHISTTDPQAELARSKHGLTELNYKEHRLVDDAHGVITAVVNTTANVADGSQLPGLYEQHVRTTGLRPAEVTLAGDHHYGTADNYLYCARQGLRAHLAEADAHLAQRGKLPLSRFVYEPEEDRLRCPQGCYLVLHQHRPEQQLKVYLIEDAALCAGCRLRSQCTQSRCGRSICRHVQAEVVEAARAQAQSAAGRYSRRRRRHVMEGSFADAANNHGAKKARWRNLWRQQIQGWMIAAVQNLRILLRHAAGGTGPVAVAAWSGAPGAGNPLSVLSLIRGWGHLVSRVWRFWANVGVRELGALF